MIGMKIFSWSFPFERIVSFPGVRRSGCPCRKLVSKFQRWQPQRHESHLVTIRTNLDSQSSSKDQLYHAKGQNRGRRRSHQVCHSQPPCHWMRHLPQPDCHVYKLAPTRVLQILGISPPSTPAGLDQTNWNMECDGSAASSRQS